MVVGAPAEAERGDARPADVDRPPPVCGTVQSIPGWTATGEAQRRGGPAGHGQQVDQHPERVRGPAASSPPTSGCRAARQFDAFRPSSSTFSRLWATAAPRRTRWKICRPAATPNSVIDGCSAIRRVLRASAAGSCSALVAYAANAEAPSSGRDPGQPGAAGRDADLVDGNLRQARRVRHGRPRVVGDRDERAAHPGRARADRRPVRSASRQRPGPSSGPAAGDRRRPGDREQGRPRRCDLDDVPLSSCPFLCVRVRRNPQAAPRIARPEGLRKDCLRSTLPARTTESKSPRDSRARVSTPNCRLCSAGRTSCFGSRQWRFIRGRRIAFVEIQRRSGSHLEGGFMKRLALLSLVIVSGGAVPAFADHPTGATGADIRRLQTDSRPARRQPQPVERQQLPRGASSAAARASCATDLTALRRPGASSPRERPRGSRRLPGRGRGAAALDRRPAQRRGPRRSIRARARPVIRERTQRNRDRGTSRQPALVATARREDRVEGTVAESVRVDGRVVIPAGATRARHRAERPSRRTVLQRRPPRAGVRPGPDAERPTRRHPLARREPQGRGAGSARSGGPRRGARRHPRRQSWTARRARSSACWWEVAELSSPPRATTSSCRRAPS